MRNFSKNSLSFTIILSICFIFIFQKDHIYTMWLYLGIFFFSQKLIYVVLVIIPIAKLGMFIYIISYTCLFKVFLLLLLFFLKLIHLYLSTKNWDSDYFLCLIFGVYDFKFISFLLFLYQLSITHFSISDFTVGFICQFVAFDLLFKM